jgi:hypothetical protein
MALVRVFQLVDNSRNRTRVVKNCKTYEECVTWLSEPTRYADLMGDISLTIQETWTNSSDIDFE